MILGIALFAVPSYLLYYYNYSITWQALSNKKTINLDTGYLSHNEMQEIEQILHSFDGSAAFSNPSKTIRVDYSLKGVATCFVENSANINNPVFKKLRSLIKDRAFDWRLIQIEKFGYYEDDQCFAAYVNPIIGFHLKNYKEAANLSEMLIRRIYAPYIRSRINYQAAKRVELQDFSKNMSFTKNDARTLFGRYDHIDDKIYLNTNVVSVTDQDIFWRLLHEMHHTFSSPLLTNDLLSRSTQFFAMNESITEYLGDYVANRIGGHESNAPAISALLSVVDQNELFDAYFNGRFLDLKKEVDAKTYDGAFCTLWYYLDKIDSYGHKDSDLYLKALTDRTIKVPGEYCSYYFEK